MTIPVPPDRLAQAVARFDSAILITATAPGRFVKIHTVDPRVEDGELVVDHPRGSAIANAAADAHVTLVWAARERHGWSLIVDGLARTEDEGARLVVSTAGGMLHRPASHADGPAWTWER